MQIAAQQQEFDQMYGGPLEKTELDAHGSFRDEAEARIEERRRAMEIAALIVDRHLHLLQKRDIKDVARAAQVKPEELMRRWSSSAPSIRDRGACTTANRRG